MSLEYIRKTYGVPAKRGVRVEYTGRGKPELGTLKGAKGARVLVLLDGHSHNGIFHPTWMLKYLTEEKPCN